MQAFGFCMNSILSFSPCRLSLVDHMWKDCSSILKSVIPSERREGERTAEGTIRGKQHGFEGIQYPVTSSPHVTGHIVHTDSLEQHRTQVHQLKLF